MESIGQRTFEHARRKTICISTVVRLSKQPAWSIGNLIQIYLVCPLCSIFFEQRVTEICYHRESRSRVPKYNFGTTARLWFWHNRCGTFIIPIPRDKFNTSIVILNWSPVRFQVHVECLWAQTLLKGNVFLLCDRGIHLLLTRDCTDQLHITKPTRFSALLSYVILKFSTH